VTDVAIVAAKRIAGATGASTQVAAEGIRCESAARDGRSHIPWDCGQRQSA
jgi:hypothetical protein